MAFKVDVYGQDHVMAFFTLEKAFTWLVVYQISIVVQSLILAPLVVQLTVLSWIRRGIFLSVFELELVLVFMLALALFFFYDSILCLYPVTLFFFHTIIEGNPLTIQLR